MCVSSNPSTVTTRDFNTKILPHSPDKMQVIVKVMDDYTARVFLTIFQGLRLLVCTSNVCVNYTSKIH